MMRTNSAGLVVDEMFPERMDGVFDEEMYLSAGPSGSGHHFGNSYQMDGSNEKYVHTDFYNAFDELFDDEDYE